MEHDCKQEKLLGEMAANIENIKTDQAETKISVGKIFTSLDGKEGMVSRVALLEYQFVETAKNAPTIKRMMAIGAAWGGIGSAVVLIGFFGIKALVSWGH